MYLPVIIAPKNNETTASWIRRLTLANGFDNTEEFAQQFICDSDIANEQRFKAMLGTEDFISLYKALNLQGVSMWDLYMKTSCYGGIAPFLSDARQTHYLNTAFRLGASNNSIVSASNSLTSELRFCPLCKKEDEVAGGWYYHRAHQMPSIKVCHKHGSILRRFTGKFGTELSASPQSVSCTNTENSWEQDFAVFAKELLDAAPDISAENTKAAVLREVKCQGFYAPASEYAKLNTALKNAGVYVSSLSRLFVQMYDMNYVAIDDLMRLCWFLFGTADKFISACKQVQKPTVPLQLPEGYTACSPYHRNIMEFEHSCGTRFCINPVGFMNGWQCPVCDGAMSLQQQYEKVVRWTGHGDYTVEGKFKGMEQPIILCHKCGRTINRPARDFVYDGARCICESTRTFEEMQDKIQSYGDFELLKYDPKTERVQIHHKGCGRNFEIGYVKFLKVPVCKVCQPAIRNNETFKREIKELVGDEYELVGEYSDKDTKVVLRHNHCGTEQEYKVAHFLRGQRCSKCSRDIPIPRFAEIVSERSCGRYQFIKMKTQNQALLLDNETKKEICMERYYALQELLRPTPSEILPCEHPVAAEPLKLRKSEVFLSWLRENYTADSEMTMKDMTRRSTLAYSEIKRIVQSLKDDGSLVWIRKEGLDYYKSGRAKTYEDAYDFLCMKYYGKYEQTPEGVVKTLLPASARPTFRQFYYYCKTNITPEEIDAIKTSRQEQRNNKRLLLSDSLKGINGPWDCFEMDEVEVDLSLVSVDDPTRVVGRPIVYVMLDVYTRMIAAVSIAFDNNSVLGFTNCLMNLADNKVEYCKKYGLTITENIWPSGYLPLRIRCDRGAEYRSKRVNQICKELGINIQLVTAGTGSLKGNVEQLFHIMHSAQNPDLENKGLIEKRYDSMHHKEARLNVDDFTKMFLNFVVTYNQYYFNNYPLTKDMLTNNVRPIPIELWKYGTFANGFPTPIANKDQFFYALLTPVNARISRTGVVFDGLYYVNYGDRNFLQTMYISGTKRVPFECRIDERDISNIYYLRDGKLCAAPLNSERTGNSDYAGLTYAEYKALKKEKKRMDFEGTEHNRQIRVARKELNKAVIDSVDERQKNVVAEVNDTEELRKNRRIEQQEIANRNSLESHMPVATFEDTSWQGKPSDFVTDIDMDDWESALALFD